MKKPGDIIKGILIVCLVLAFFGAVFSGCKSKTVFVPVEIEKTIKETEIIRDTVVGYPIEQDKKQNTVQLADTSRLENKYALSWAFWDGLFLHHNLETKPDTIPIKVQTKDKITVITFPVIVPIKGDTVYVNKLYWWQNILIIIGLVCLVVIGFRLFSFLRK